MSTCKRCHFPLSTKFNGDTYCSPCTQPEIAFLVVNEEKDFRLGVSELRRAERLKEIKGPGTEIIDLR